MTTLRTLVPLLALLLAPVALAQTPTVTGGPMVGATSDTSATIWLRTDGPCEVTVSLSAVAGGGAVNITERTDADADSTATFTFAALQPATEYEYHARIGRERVEGGRFRTMPAAGTGKVTIAFGSCVNMARQAEQPIFDVIAAARPSAFVFLGDNSYFTNDDCKEAATMWARVREQRQNPGLRKLLASTPIFAQWDDHDYGPNDSDRTFKLKTVARDIFKAYWPMPAYGDGDDGIYSRATLGPVDLFVLDDRWFRSPANEPDGPDKAILGPKQRDWLIEQLAASRAPVKLVATGSQFLARYHAFESWQRARVERDAIVDAIRDRKIPGVVFISGDRHLAEALRWPAERAGYTLWEVTSSPLANRSFTRGADVKNEDRAFIYGDGNNFGWIEVDLDARKVTLELRDAQGKTLWSVMPDDLLAPAGEPKKRFF
jgi:alkaline phosphatase D